MFKYRSLLGLTLLSLAIAELKAEGQSATWNSSATMSHWGDPENWDTKTVPERPGDLAIFEKGSGTLLLAGRAKESISPQLTELNFKSSKSYILQQPSSGESSLGFIPSKTAPASIRTDEGTYTINVPIRLFGNTELNIGDKGSLIFEKNALLQKAPNTDAVNVAINPKATGSLVNKGSGFGSHVEQITIYAGNITNSGSFGSSGTTLVMENGNTLNEGAATMAAEEITVKAGTYTNHGYVTVTNDFISESPLAAINNVNTLPVSTPAAGCSITTMSGDLQLSGQTFNNINEGTISNTKGAATGSLVMVNNNLKMEGANTLLNRNTGAISGSPTNAGAVVDIETVMHLMNTCSLQKGTITNINEGEIGAGVGSEVYFDKNLHLSGCTISTTNTSSKITGGTGSRLTVTQDLDITADHSVSLTNTGDFSATGTATGSQLNVSGNVNIRAPGSISLQNQGRLTGTVDHTVIGCHGTVAGNLAMHGGKISLNNSEAPLTDATGVALDIIGTFTMKNATVGNMNKAATFTGSRFSAASITIETSTFTNENAQAKTTTGGLAVHTDGVLTNTSLNVRSTYGSQVSVANGCVVSGNGVIRNSNEGTVENSLKSNYGSDLLIMNNGITMNGGVIQSTNTAKGTVKGSPLQVGASIRTQGTGGLTLSGGAITCQNDGTVIAGIGSLLSLAGPLAISNASSTLSFNNTQPVESGYGTKLVTPAISLDKTGGNLTLSNTADLRKGAVGSYGIVSNTFKIEGGTLNLINTGTLDNTTGVQLDVIGAFTLAAGTVNNTSKPSLSKIPGSKISMGSLDMTGGVFNNASAHISSTIGEISGGVLNNQNIGSRISFDNGLKLSEGGVIHNFNDGTVDLSSGVFYGAEIASPTAGIAVTGGLLNNINTGIVSGSPQNAGAAVCASDLTIAKGVVACENSGAVSAGVGAALKLSENLVINEGTVVLTNAGKLSRAIGCSLAAKGLYMAGGSFLLENNVDLSSGTGVQAVISGTSPLISGGTLTLWNKGQLTDAIGTSLDLIGDLSMTGGNLINKNAGSRISAHSITVQPEAAALIDNTGQIKTVENLNIYKGSVIKNTGEMTVGGSLNIYNGSLQNSSSLLIQNTLIMTNGSLENKNSSDAGSAVHILSGGLSLSGGTISCENNGTIKSGTGSFFTTHKNGDLDISNAAIFNVHNNAALTSAAGAHLDIVNLKLTGGSLHLSNSANVSDSAGALATVHGSVNMLGGSIVLSNTGSLNNAIGTFLDIAGAFNIHAGDVSNLSSGSANGSKISAGSILMSTEGKFTNTGLVSTVHDFTISKGTLANEGQILVGNSFNIKGAAIIDQTNGSFEACHINVNIGTLKITNANHVSSTVRSMENFTLSSGTVHLSNTSQDSAGTKLHVGRRLHVSGGKLINETIKDNRSGSIVEAGSISISGGTFVNNAKVKADTVAMTGGVFAGHGVVETSSFVNGGTVIPGDPVLSEPGTLTIQGAYTQKPEGRLHLHLLPDGSLFGHLVAENADLNGHLILEALEPLRSTNGRPHFEIISTDPQGIKGVFNPANIEYINIPDELGPSLQYLHDQVLLVFGHPPIEEDNPAPPAVPLVTSYQGGTSYQMLFNLINRNNFRLEREMQRLQGRFPDRKVESQLTLREEPLYVPTLAAPSFNRAPSCPTNHQLASSKSPLLAFFNWSLLQRKQEQLHEEVIAPPPKEQPWNLYFGPTAAVGTINTKKNQLGCDYWDIAGLVAFDYAFDQVGVGAVVDYDRNQVTVHKHWGKYHFNHFHTSLYATYAPKILPEIAFNAIVGAGRQWYDFRRNVPAPIHKTAQAHTKGQEFDAFFAAEYFFTSQQFSKLPERLQIIPRASLQYIYIDVNKFREHNAGIANVKLHTQNAKSLRSGLDLWVKYTWEWTDFSFAPEFNIGWQREYFDKNHEIFFTPIGISGPTTPINVFGAGRSTMVAGVDLFFEFYQRYGLELMYDYQWNERFRDNSLYLGLNVRF